MNTYTTVWSGAMERQGTAEGLSRMIGPSSLNCLSTLPAALKHGNATESGEDSDILARKMLRDGWTHSDIVNATGLTLWGIHKLSLELGIVRRRRVLKKSVPFAAPRAARA